MKGGFMNQFFEGVETFQVLIIGLFLSLCFIISTSVSSHSFPRNCIDKKLPDVTQVAFIIK